MSAKTVNMTEGPLSRQIFLFSIPLILSNLLQIVFTISDVAVVGQFAGSLALGAVGSTTTLVMLFTGILIGIGSGVNVLVARYCGSRDDRGAQETIHTSAIVSLLFGLILMVIGECITSPLLSLLGTKPELMAGATLYLRIYFLGMPALAIYNFGNAVYSAVGNTKKPLIFLSLSGVLNVLLNLFTVIVLHMSVAGVAIASIAAQYLSAVLITVSLMRETGIHRFRFSALRWHNDKALRVIAISVPSGLQNAIFHVANLFIQSAVNTFDTVLVNGNSAAANADGLVFDILAAFYTACSSFMSQNYGAGNRKRVRQSYFISLAYSLTSGVLLGALLLLFGRQFLGLFTSDAPVIEAGLIRLTIMALSYFMSAFMDCTIAASRGIGKTLWPTLMVILGSCVFRIAWILTVFRHFGTPASLYLLYIFSWTITAICEIIYFAVAYRKQMRVIDHPSSPSSLS